MLPDALLLVSVILSALAVGLCIVIIYRFGRGAASTSPILEQRLVGIERAIGRSDAILRDEFGRGRDETRDGARSLREEISGLFERLAGSLRGSLNDLSTGQQGQLETFAARLNEARTGASADARNLREEIQLVLKQLGEAVGNRISELVTAQSEKLDSVTGQITALTEGNERRQEVLRTNVEAKLGELKTDAGLNAKALREEMQSTLQRLGETITSAIGQLVTLQGEKLDAVTGQITALTEGNERRQDTLRANVEAKLGELKTDAGLSAKALREEITSNLQTLGSALGQTIEQISQSQKERLDRVSGSVTELTQKSGEQQEALRKTVEERLDAIRRENTEKLDQMRQTVDEKLQSTLDQRLGASFQIVADRLEQVYRSMGEMQTLASGVGDLKRLLTNVKSRGTWGEVALGNLLEEMMAPDQYGRNVEIVPGSNQRVEYAVRLPGDGENPVWLPLDAKFPVEDYERLVDASQRGDVDAVEIAAKAIETVIRGSARTISEKYIHSPHSTDFAVLFLPTEGLFAEVVRRPGLVDTLQREWHIMVAGPTTLVSLLVSLRVGFRSLAIQRHSNEVWKVLAAVKTEFGRFGGLLDKVSKKLQQTQNVIDVEVGRSRRAMDRKLQDVEVLPEIEALAVLELDGPEETVADEEAERYAAE
jgi:DNA recombination protein RmuC